MHHSVALGGFGFAGHKIGICEERTVNSLASKHTIIVEKFRDKDPVSCCLSWGVTLRVLLAFPISITQILDRWDYFTPVCIPAVIE